MKTRVASGVLLPRLSTTYTPSAPASGPRRGSTGGGGGSGWPWAGRSPRQVAPAPQVGLPRDPPLPVGFQSQLFGRLFDASGAQVPSTFTWGTTTPGLLSIDENGVVTGAINILVDITEQKQKEQELLMMNLLKARQACNAAELCDPKRRGSPKLDEFETLDIVGHTKKLTPIFIEGLNRLKETGLVSKVRGEGLVFGINAADRLACLDTRALCQALFGRLTAPLIASIATVRNGKARLLPANTLATCGTT